MKNQAVVAVKAFQSNRGDLMIHGIYLKSRPKGKWHLVSVTSSLEDAAAHDIDELLKQAKLEGYDNAEAASRCFETSFHIPELLNEIKPQKPMFN